MKYSATHRRIQLVIIFLISILIQCEKEANDNDTIVLSPIEEKIINQLERLMPEHLCAALEEELILYRQNPNYDSYLDSLDQAILELTAAVEQHFSLQEFNSAILNFEEDISNLSGNNKKDKSNQLSQLGLGYGKGVSIEGCACGAYNQFIAESFECYYGGASVVVYDFVNMESIVYIQTICDNGTPIGSNLTEVLSSGLGFCGYVNWIQGINWNYNSGDYECSVPSTGMNESISMEIKKTLGLDIGYPFAQWCSLDGNCTDVSNLEECPIYFPGNINGLKGYMVDLGANGSMSPVHELLVALSEGDIGICSYPVEETYSEYNRSQYGRMYASIKMSTSILSPESGLGMSFSLPGNPFDLIAAVGAIEYGFCKRGACAVNTAPSAILKVSQAEGTVGEPIFFNASESFDNEDPVSSLTVEWDWESDNIWDTDPTNSKTSIHQFSEPGKYMIRLRVKDSSGEVDIASAEVNIAPSSFTGNWNIIELPYPIGRATSITHIPDNYTKRFITFLDMCYILNWDFSFTGEYFDCSQYAGMGLNLTKGIVADKDYFYSNAGGVQIERYTHAGEFVDILIDMDALADAGFSFYQSIGTCDITISSNEIIISGGPLNITDNIARFNKTDGSFISKWASPPPFPYGLSWVPSIETETFSCNKPEGCIIVGQFGISQNGGEEGSAPFYVYSPDGQIYYGSLPPTGIQRQTGLDFAPVDSQGSTHELVLYCGYLSDNSVAELVIY